MTDVQVYTDLSDVPNDPTPEADVVDIPDDQKPDKSEISLTLLLSQTVSKGKLVVPYGRLIKLGTKGNDVKGAKRAIWRANGLKLSAFTATFGPIAVTQLRRFQKKHNLHVDGQLGRDTLKALAPYFDAYAYFLYVGQAPSSNKTQQLRNNIYAYSLWGYNNAPAIHYAQARPMDHLVDLKYLPIWDDCSEFATKAYKFANAPDPNNSKYNGLGWTGTMGQNGKIVSLAQAQVGDLVLYGPKPNFEHVAIYVGNGRVISHGSEGGPYLLPVNYRSDFEIRTYL